MTGSPMIGLSRRGAQAVTGCSFSQDEILQNFNFGMMTSHQTAFWNCPTTSILG